MINKYLIICIIIIIIIYLIYINNYKSINKLKHKDNDSLYAHFSQVDKYNYLLFPKLIFCNPIYINLKGGESLYIPKKWWHWIKTTEKTFAINYWFKNNNYVNKPFIFKDNNNYDINIFNDENVTVWDSLMIKSPIKMNFKKFYNSNEDNKYLITLENYNIGYSNINIKKKINSLINFPYNNKIQINGFDYNIWISSGKHDTGLHYDDEDGILSVIEGKKKIILFPQSDTPYLYAYKTSFNWLNDDAYNFRYNTFENLGKINSKSSSQLLYETCKDDIRVLSNISKLYKLYCNTPESTLVWGFKKNKDIYRWEFYKYTLDKTPSITSWDIHSNEYKIGDEEHYYFNLKNEVKLPFWGYGKYINKSNSKILYEESKIFVIDTFDSFMLNYKSYMYKLKYFNLIDSYYDIIFNKYKCYQICIHNKNEEQIFIQYLGISNSNFIDFLMNNNYPRNIIDFIDENYKINNEITIVYDIKSKKIIRTGFYGIITNI